MEQKTGQRRWRPSNEGRDAKGRFAKGNNCNPLGRGAAASNWPGQHREFTSSQAREDFLFLMEEEVEVTVNGEVRRMPISSMILQQQIHKAAEGNRLAAKMVIEWQRAMLADRSAEIEEGMMFIEDWKVAEEKGQTVPDSVKDILTWLPKILRSAGKRPA